MAGGWGGLAGRAPNHTTIVVFIFVAEAIFTIIIISSWLLRFNLPTVGTWERERKVDAKRERLWFTPRESCIGAGLITNYRSERKVKSL